MKATLEPNVIDRTENGERAYDIYSRRVEDRIVFITGELNDALAITIVTQLICI